jgi:hypothetical protein
MLLGSAIALGHGIDLINPISKADDSATRETHEAAGKNYVRRRDRLRRLLFIYITQLACRVGCSISKQPFHSAMDTVIHGPDVSSEPEWHDFVTCWIDLTRLARSSSEILFPVNPADDFLFNNCRYVELRDHFCSLLLQWLDKYKAISSKVSSSEPFLPHC